MSAGVVLTDPYVLLDAISLLDKDGDVLKLQLQLSNHSDSIVRDSSYSSDDIIDYIVVATPGASLRSVIRGVQGMLLTAEEKKRRESSKIEEKGGKESVYSSKHPTNKNSNETIRSFLLYESQWVVVADLLCPQPPQPTSTDTERRKTNAPINSKRKIDSIRSSSRNSSRRSSESGSVLDSIVDSMPWILYKSFVTDSIIGNTLCSI